MSKKRTKRHKSKKKLELIRTDVWNLVTLKSEKEQMLLTIEEYRKYLLPLVIIVNSQWINLSDLTASEKVNAVEKMIHKTADNPNPKHKYFQSIIKSHPSHRKFPSYLRRAAIADAIGIVSSFQTRYREWQSGIRARRDAKPPRLTAMCNTYPVLYKSQQIRYNLNYQTVDIKVWSGTDWVWLSGIKVKRHGLNRHLTDGNEICSPALVVNKNKCQLSMPVKIEKINREDFDYVVSVDLGINNAATCAVVGKDGTVKARKFVNPASYIDRRNQRRMMIAKKSKQTQNITNSKRKKGFCKGLYRKSSHINLEISRQVSSCIVEFAKAHNVKIIVIESLAGWKAKAGKKGSLLKQKFHLWCHAKIVEIVTDRWSELGGQVQAINPKYTSAYAFDGSGKVKRDKNNYSLAKFATGKLYNADLSASYNIGARYWYCLIVGDKTFSRVFVSQSSNDTLRTPVTLDSLRSITAS
ncbi:MAG: transposase [Gloeotrichia echinulata IR180]|jgi:putative transposase|nr:IS200/IS605 family accessory protein TnpB-related protein [Gloeotrichia echinulata DEX184]MCM0591012.1 IS200/IS605 family accessory protein TnpB-related protein [Gloeotrichia echinulata DEX184]